jgi:heme oxygenase (biliverdin-IX-beta and delta-forming)
VISTLLRQHTAGLHARVERVVDLPARCRSLASYRLLLARLLGLYAPLERDLARVDWAAVGIEFGPRRKVDWLLADLRALALTPEQIDALPACEPALGLPAPAAAVGCLYVLEGATFGGQVMTATIRTTLGIERATGGSFHAGYGASTRAMWRSYCDAANRFCGEDPAKVAGALATASATFEAFADWLGRP